MRLYQVTGASTTRFAYDGLDMIAEYDGSSALLRRYVHGPGMDQPLVQYEGSGTSDRRFLHADERGSIVATSDSSGAMLTINRYDEYGIPQSTNAGRFQYTGQMWLGELGLYHYKARAYSPTLGRFLQTDPIGFEGDGPNLYAYVLNDPVNFVDPLGLSKPTEDEVIIVTARRNVEPVDSYNTSAAKEIAAAGGLSRGAAPSSSPGESVGTEANPEEVVVTAKPKTSVKIRVLRIAIGGLEELADLLKPSPGRQEGESYSDCVRRLAGDGALAAAGATAVAAGANILPYPRAVPPGGSGTSIISTISRGAFSGLSRMSFRIAGTTSVGGAVGRILSGGSVLGGAATLGLSSGKTLGAAQVCAK